MMYFCPDCEAVVDGSEIEDKEDPVCPECGSVEIRPADDAEPEVKDG